MPNILNTLNILANMPNEQLKEKKIYSFIRKNRNYSPFHWFLESLPTFLMYTEKNSIDYYLVSPQKHYIVESLILLGIPKEKIIYCDNLEIPLDYNIIDIPIQNCWDWPPHEEEKRCLLIKDALTKNLSAVQNNNLKLFISREDSPYVRIENNDYVKEVLLKLGFTILVLHNIPLEEQIQMFRGASCVIGAQGAGLVNILFCQKNTKIIEIFNDIRRYDTYKNMSKQFHLKYVPLIFPVAEKNINVPIENNNNDINITVEVEINTLLDNI